MKRFVYTLAALVALSIPTVASAQTPVVPSDKLTWDQADVDLTTVNNLTFRLYADGVATGAVLTPVTCVNQTPVLTGNFTCSTPFPAFTPTVTHSVTVSAANAAGESLKSTPFSFKFVVIPFVPTNLRRTP